MQEKTGEKGRRQIQAAKSWPWTRQTEKEIKNILLLTVTYDWAWALVPSQLGLMSSCFTCSCKQDQQTDPSFCLLGGCCFFLLVCLFVCFLCRARCLTWGRTSGKQFYPVIGFLLACMNIPVAGGEKIMQITYTLCWGWRSWEWGLVWTELHSFMLSCVHRDWRLNCTERYWKFKKAQVRRLVTIWVHHLVLET